MCALALLAPVLACTDDESAEPTPEPRVTTSTAFIDRSGVVLAPVGGETTTTIRETGSARIVGSVSGPAGLIPGATVRIERIVADGTIRTDVATGADGRFALEGVPGGRYRVRAYAPPDLAQLEAELRFLADREEHSFDLVLEEQTEIVVRASSAPEPARVDQPVNLVVQIAERQVDADGIVRTVPRSGVRVELVGLGRWSLRRSGLTSSATASVVTDNAGRARWELECLTPGSPGLALRIPVAVPAQPPATTVPGAPSTTSGPAFQLDTVHLDLPDCAAPAPTTTSTSVPSSATSTTAGDG